MLHTGPRRDRLKDLTFDLSDYEFMFSGRRVAEPQEQHKEVIVLVSLYEERTTYYHGLNAILKYFYDLGGGDFFFSERTGGPEPYKLYIIYRKLHSILHGSAKKKVKITSYFGAIL